MRLLISCLLAAMLATAAPSAHAIGPVDCKLHFSMSGWSAFYKTLSGSGPIICDNGQSMAVSIRSKGGGLTFGKSRIENGVGEFSGVRDIHDLLGTYAAAEAHAGAVRSAHAQVVTKGDISLALAGKGEGWDLGVAFGNFIISAR
jgi:hypothetical protein